MNLVPDRMHIDDWTDVPHGLKPDGSLLLSYDELPLFLPSPSRVWIGECFMEIDGWVIAFAKIRKGMLEWLAAQLHAWRDADPSEENRLWCAGIVEALCDRMLVK
jgi:hypothetical protein